MSSLAHFMRFAPSLVALSLFACNFDPAARPPTTARDAQIGGGGADAAVSDAVGPSDAHRSSDASSNLPDVATDVGAPSPDAAPGTRDASTDATTDAAPPDGGDEEPDMDPQPIVCDGRVVDPMTNAEHCGRCDNACDSEHGSCAGGTCACAFGATACGADNACIDTGFDPNNCGACGTVCAAGELCIEGGCVCRPGLTRCAGACVDTESDPEHCGGCAVSCNGKACLEGTCENRNNCPFGTFTCDTPGGLACVKGREGDLHCGPRISDPCGTACEGDQFCQDPGLFSGPECVTYRPGIGCTECPCSDCEDGEACVQTDDIPDVAFCVRR